MSDAQGVATKRRRLRTELRRLREAAGLHQSDVAKLLDWSVSKVIRIENGSVGVSVTDVRALAGIYRTDPGRIDELVTLARVTRERQWWSAYHHILSPSYREFIGYEADATAMLQAHPTAIPGLLQTEDYMRAIIGSTSLGAVPAGRAEAEFEVRCRRRDEILLSGRAPQYSVILDEGALRRHIGGAKVMLGQLEHLTQLSADLVTIGIMPFRAGGYLAMQGAFQIMDFASVEDASVLFLETATGNPVQRDLDHVARYREAFEAMLQRSVRGVEAVAFIRQVADELD